MPVALFSLVTWREDRCLGKLSTSGRSASWASVYHQLSRVLSFTGAIADIQISF